MADKLPDKLDDLLNSIRNEEEEIEAPSSEEIDKKIRDYELEKRNKELTEKFLNRIRKKKEEKEEIPEGLDELLASITGGEKKTIKAAKVVAK